MVLYANHFDLHPAGNEKEEGKAAVGKIQEGGARGKGNKMCVSVS